MNSDFPKITGITEVRRDERDRKTLRLDLRTEGGQRYVRLSGEAARELADALDALLNDAEKTEVIAGEKTYHFKM